MWLAIVGIRVALGEACNCSTKMLLSFREFATSHMPAADRVLSAAITCIPPNRFKPIGLWATRGMTILLEMQPNEKKLITILHIHRQWRFCGHCGRLGRYNFFRGMPQ